MKVEIIKKEVLEYGAGDVLLVHNAYEVESKNYLLYEDEANAEIGVIDLESGLVHIKYSKDITSFDGIIQVCEEEINSTESHVFKSNETRLILGGSDN